MNNLLRERSSVAHLSLLLLMALCLFSKAHGADRLPNSGQNDPLEPFNRTVMEINFLLDDAFLRPLSMFYRDITSPIFRQAARNITQNLETPLVAANDALQGDLEAASVSVARFAVNSTIGILGISDPATNLRLPHHHNDFGKTLFVYGLGDGPPIALPFRNIMPMRDAFGNAMGSVAEQTLAPWHEIDYAQTFVVSAQMQSIAGARTQYAPMIRQIRLSNDPYALSKTIMLQRRRAFLMGPQKIDVEALPNVELE
ncbi:MAG: MlaA family lipoprotein [Alphaproteobacteria bacterium]